MFARLCVVIFACWALAGCALIGSAAQPTPGGYQWTGAPLNPPLSKPSFTLTDDHNIPYNFRAETEGEVTLLYFGYTHCPNLCPENMAMLAFALKDLPAIIRAKVVVVFVTTDPNRDTPSVLATWLDKFNPTFIGLTGSVTQVDVAQVFAHVPVASPVPDATGAGYLVDHPAQIIVYTPDNVAHLEFFEGMLASGVAHDLDHLVTQGWTNA
ncbi:MAG: SCO family protein [Candidatus Dormibacteria bacterium]